MNQRPNNSLLRALDALFEGRPGAWFINIVAIPAMLLLIFILPPLAIPSRILSAGYTGVSPARGGGVSVEDGTQFSVPANASKTSVNLKLSMMKRDAFMKSTLAKDLPIILDVKSAAYQPSVQGNAPALSILSINLPDDIDPISTLDVYGLNGKKWIKIPFQMYLDEYRVDAYLTSFVPSVVVLGQTLPQAPAISADVSAKNPLAPSASSVVAEISPVGLAIADGGGVAGSVPALPETGSGSPYQVLPTVGNLEGTIARSDLVEAMVSDKEIRKQHVQALVDLTVEKLYPGVNIDYQGVNSDSRKDFTAFVAELAQAMHAKDKILSVTLPMPTQKAQDTWDTGAYDWDAIGLVADIVRIPAPVNRTAYANDPSLAYNYLQWAVGRVDRYKLQLTFSMMSRDEFNSAFAPVPFANASKLMGPVNTTDRLQPGDRVTLELPKLRENGGIKFDDPSGIYTFVYKDDKGQAHTVALENAESLARKIGLAQQFNLRGIALNDLSNDSAEPRVWDALKSYRESQNVAFRGAPVILWRANGQNIGTSAVNVPQFAWTAPNQPGESKVEAAISLDNGKTAAGSTGPTSLQVLPPPTAIPTVAPVVIARPTAAPAAPAAVAAPPSAFRGQNLFGYGAQLNWTNSDNNAEMGQLQQMGFKWAKVQIRWCDFESNRGNADLSQIDRLMGAADAKGIKVMFSVVCAPNWSRSDRGAGGSGPPDNMQDAADFMSGLAAKYCGRLGAIEVWNEHNLLTEWHGKSINAALYMDMLKKSYTAIKAKCPSVVVVSGAPTPTGVMTSTAIDDVVFLEQMYQNGLKDYSDAIGSHPSGFANAPSAAPGTPNAIGQFQGHRSFYFRGTMEAYRAIMVKYGDSNKQIWPTEFGWAVTPNPHHGYEYAKFISLDQQAKWLVESYQMMKAWGWVGVAIMWNLDFTDLGNETGAFHVLNRPAFGALQGMPK